MSEIAPVLWSDFDGTAVAIAKKTNPRNLSKYPLPEMRGYANFLQGFASTDGEIAGVISERPDTFIRRMATARSIAKLGYGNFFPRRDQIVHMGSEEAKGRFVAEQSRKTTIGVLEDKPHKLGAVLLGALTEDVEQPEQPQNPILLGVVKHAQSQRHIEELAKYARRITSNDISVAWTGPMTSVGINIEANGISLQVVQLEPFSIFSGEKFGHQLLELAAK